ncbi:hypothetical protein Tco_1105064 [Tanacetum coccineum]
MKTITVLKNDFKKEESRKIDREIALEKNIKLLDNNVYKRDQSAQIKALQFEPKLYDGNVIKNTSVIMIPDSEETLILVEESRSKMLLKQQDPEFRAITTLKEELRKLKGKSVVACRESVNKPKVIALVMLNLDLEPLSSKLKSNRESHVDYIRITKENVDTLCNIVEQARTSNTLDNTLAYACMYTKQIQELLVYVSDTCLSSPLKSGKLVAVTPMNKARKVTYAKTSTTSDNNTQIQVDVHQTQTTNKPLVPSTNVKCFTNASRSKPHSGNKEQKGSSNLSSNLEKIKKINNRARAKAVKSIIMKEWKPTGKMFKNIRYKWVPTRRIFTIVGTKCSLTISTSTKIVPLRKPIKSTCQLDEQWFDLTQDTLRDALQITPVDKNRAFSPPPTPDTLIKFVNELGYPREVINLSNVTTNDMFQPWRALATIINLCLTGKTSGFERPRAPVLQILWGVVNRAHIDYAERMWEEFTQSIHNFTEDKRNLAQQAQGKKKATIILIPSIRFTKLIIFHLQRLHNFHPRPESPLHLPTEEPVLGNLKFSAKGTKREVFGMTIPNELINDVIRGADYYEAYLNKVAKHQRHLAGEEVSDPDSPAPKPAKPTKQTKPKPTKQSKPTEPKTASKKPKPAPAKPQKKKRKPVSESSDAPPLAKRAKAGKVVKKRTAKSSKQLVDEFIDEGVPAAKPRLEDRGEIWKTVLQESLTDAYPTQRGPLPPVVRETDTRKFQPLPEVSGKGKEKVVPTETAGREDSTSLYAELGLSGSDTESDEEMPSVVRSGAQDEGQAGPDPGKLDEGADQIPSTTTEPLDEGFTAAAYPEVQENLKLKVDEQVIPEEPVSSTGTLSSLQHLAKDFSFGDQFLNDKPSEADNEKSTAGHRSESMTRFSNVMGLCQPHYTTAAPPHHQTTTADTLPLPPQASKQGSSDSILIKRMGELEQHIADLVEENQALEKRLDKQGSRIHKLENVDLSKMIREQMESIRRDECEDFDDDKAQGETKKKSKQDSPNTPPGSPPSPPPPPLPPSGASGASGITGASDSAQAPPPPPLSSSNHQGGQSTALRPQFTKIKETAIFSGDEVGRGHIPSVNLSQRLVEPLTEGQRPSCLDIPSSDLKLCQQNNWLALKRPAFDIVKWFHPNVIHLKFQMEGVPRNFSTDQVDDTILRYHYRDRRAVRTHMRILSVVRIEVFSMYGYNYMKKIVLRRADLKEYVIAERDFKYMYPSDFEDLYLLNLQGHLNHLSPEDKKILTTAVNLWTRNLVIRQRVEDFQLGIESYQTQLNLTKPRWEATGFEFKHDFTVIDSPRAVIFRDKYGVQMIMRFNEIHKFSDGTLQQIDEALDYRVKEFRINRTNPGMNARFLNTKDLSGVDGEFFIVIYWHHVFQ